MSDLQEWCLKHNVKERTLTAFHNALEAYREEETMEYGKVFPNELMPIIPIFDKVCHVFSFPEFEFERVQIDMSIEYDERTVGWYRMIYEMDGSEFDDYFVIEKDNTD